MKVKFTKQEVLTTCARLAKRGERYSVHKYLWRHEQLRKLCMDMVRDGLLVAHGLSGKHYEYSRPEDAEALRKSAERHRAQMKAIYARNVQWNLEQAEKEPVLRDYHLKEAEKFREPTP